MSGVDRTPEARARQGMSPSRRPLMDGAFVFLLACVLIGPLFKVEYLDNWGSIESTFIGDARMLREHLLHPAWQPLWYCGTRFDYIYPPALRYGTALVSLVAGISTARAYHIYTAFFYALGIAGVYFLAYIASRSRAQAWLASMFTLLLSPSLFLMTNFRNDSPHWVPQRLHVLAVYGEGPHISSLSILPFALAASFVALRQWTPRWLAAAGILCAAVVATNFYGATALALFFPLLLWAVWLETRQGSILLRAAGIFALAYGLCAFWLTPSYIRITQVNMHWVAEPSKPSSVAIAAACALMFLAVTFVIAKRRAVAPWPVFLFGSAIFTSLYVLGWHYFGLSVTGDANRLAPELDLALILLGAYGLVAAWKRRILRPVVIVVLLAACFPAATYVRNRRWPFTRAKVIQQRCEFQTTKWMAEHLPGARALPSGSIRYWYDAWYDNEDAYGGSNQGMLNQILPVANWQITQGDRADLAVAWLEALGIDAVIVPDKTSEEIYHDYSHPEKFQGAIPEIYNDHKGVVIYQVPRRFPSIARVVDRAALLAALPPSGGDDREALSRYVSAVEHGPDSQANVFRPSLESFDVNATIAPGQAVLLQETFDPAWHAYSGGKALSIQPDALDFFVIDAPVGAQTIHLQFETPLQNRIGWILTLLTCAIILRLLWHRVHSNPLSWK